MYDNNRFVVLEIGNRVLTFKREIKSDLHRYNQLLENIVYQFKSVYWLSSISPCDHFLFFIAGTIRVATELLGVVIHQLG